MEYLLKEPNTCSSLHGCLVNGGCCTLAFVCVTVTLSSPAESGLSLAELLPKNSQGGLQGTLVLGELLSPIGCVLCSLWSCPAVFRAWRSCHIHESQSFQHTRKLQCPLLTLRWFQSAAKVRHCLETTLCMVTHWNGSTFGAFHPTMFWKTKDIAAALSL